VPADRSDKLSGVSEYQYYEFRKIDGSLSDRAMEEISALSSRGTCEPKFSLVHLQLW
jgi:hypothetical protein